MPPHWPSFEIRLRLLGREITLHWERDAHPHTLVKPDLQLAWGDWVELERLPAKAVLLVRGVAPPALVPAVSSPAVPQPA